MLYGFKKEGDSFVGRVKSEYQHNLQSIADNCFEENVFHSLQAKRLITHVKDSYGDTLEYLWRQYPNCAIWRRKDNEKWYGALMVIPAKKIGLPSNEPIEILDIRFNANELPNKIDNKAFFAGYHMNKKHWLTLLLNGDTDDKELFRLVHESYRLAKK